jgi:uncharacterized protein (TIGR02466 family)
MAKTEIFQEIILSDTFKDNKLEQEVLNVLEIEQQKNNGVLLSNRGGFQTQPITNEIICDTILKKCFNLMLDNFKFKINFKILLQNLWINENKKNCFNTPHVHSNSHFSGVYYLNTSNQNGEIVFYKDNAFGVNGLNHFIDFNSFNDTFSIKPHNGLLLLFPSWMRHMVNPHYEDLSRISVSFNLECVHG